MRSNSEEAQFGKMSVDYLIDGDSLTVDRDGKPLGDGGFGVVYRGEYNFAPVAVKELKVRASDLSEDTLREFRKETELMVSLRSSYVIQVFGACVDSDAYQLVMEYAPKGSLYHVLHSQEVLTWPEQHRIASEISYGMHFLHGKNVIHRDLKSLNVLMMKDGSAKITDFGLAKVKAETSSKSTSKANAVGSLLWMAPELHLADKPKYNAATDIFALAITFWEIVTRKLPLLNSQNAHAASLRMAMGKREKVPDKIPEFFSQLIISCWAQEASERPALDDVIQRLRSHDSSTVPTTVAPSVAVATVVSQDSPPAVKPESKEEADVEKVVDTLGEASSGYRSVARGEDAGTLGSNDAYRSAVPPKVSSPGTADVAIAEKGTETLGVASANYRSAVPTDESILTLGDESDYRSAAPPSPKPNATANTGSVSSLDSGQAYRSVGRDVDSLSGANYRSHTAQPPGTPSTSPASGVSTSAGGSATPKKVVPAPAVGPMAPSKSPRNNGPAASAESKRTQEIEVKKPAKPAAAATDLFKPPVDPKEVNELLRLVAEGEQDAAEEKLNKKPQLASHKGTVTDLSERTFKDITVFQYAAWALDAHMWTMILKYLPSREAGQQLNELKKYGTQHGTHADWRPLIKSLHKQVEMINNWWEVDAKKKFWQKREHYKNEDDFYAQATSHWCKTVGGHQRNLPAHVVNEYCREDRSFDPTPKFDEATLPRTRQTDEGEWFTATYNGGRLGEQWGVLRGRYRRTERAQSTAFLPPSLDRHFRPYHLFVDADTQALQRLYSKRVEQLEQLEARLTNSHSNTRGAARP